jgi:hypothetical protein
LPCLNLGGPAAWVVSLKNHPCSGHLFVIAEAKF